MIRLGCALILLAAATTAAADTVLYSAAPATYPAVTSGLTTEFGTSSFPPLSETGLAYYAVPGAGPVDVKFRFHGDTGSFFFEFGYYHLTPALSAIDTSTDAGKEAYAAAALAPGNAFVVFDDNVNSPPDTATASLTGGDVVGFFLIPDASLADFQGSPGDFALDGTGSSTFAFPPPFRWPLFGFADANPGGLDQLMSFAGVSTITGEPSNLFAWEDLTRAAIPGNPNPSDEAFNDLIFGVEGVLSVPEPGTLVLLSLGALAMLSVCNSARRRRSASA